MMKILKQAQNLAINKILKRRDKLPVKMVKVLKEKNEKEFLFRCYANSPTIYELIDMK